MWRLIERSPGGFLPSPRNNTASDAVQNTYMAIFGGIGKTDKERLNEILFYDVTSMWYKVLICYLSLRAGLGT